MTPPLAVVRIPERFQGPPGQGQGGWTASRLARYADGPVTVRLAAPTPLDIDLHVLRDGDGLLLVDPRSEPATVLMDARPWTPDVPDTTPVSIAAAADARWRTGEGPFEHPAPRCFSCGLQAESMGVHAGALGDGRVAVDWRPPAWAVDASGIVEPGVIWGALDCVAGWYVGADAAGPLAFTAQYAVDIPRPIDPGGAYAIVAWAGDGPPDWEGRKRTAASAMFDECGNVVAKARSFWIAARTN